MTETIGIHSDVTNLDYHSPPHPSESSALPYKRRMLDRWTDRIRTSGLPGTELVANYLHEKYIKNLIKTGCHANMLPVHQRFHASCGEFSFPAYQLLTGTETISTCPHPF